MRLNKSLLVELMAVDSGLSRRKSSKALASLLKIVANALATGEDVSLRGFGRFYTTIQNERQIKHPRTGQKIIISHKMVVKFKCSKLLKYKINGFDLDEFNIENKVILRQIYNLCRQWGDYEEEEEFCDD